MTTEAATATIKKQPKDLPMAQVTLQVKVCYREYKFKEGDARRDCHVGLQALDMTKCIFCTWYGDRPGTVNKVVAVSGGQDMAQLADTLGLIRERNQQDNGNPGG